VISCLGQRSRRDANLLRDAAVAILEAMARAGVRRGGHGWLPAWRSAAAPSGATAFWLISRQFQSSIYRRVASRRGIPARSKWEVLATAFVEGAFGESSLGREAYRETCSETCPETYREMWSEMCSETC
jgi:hypothetical protein